MTCPWVRARAQAHPLPPRLHHRVRLPCHYQHHHRRRRMQQVRRKGLEDCQIAGVRYVPRPRDSQAPKRPGGFPSLQPSLLSAAPSPPPGIPPGPLRTVQCISESREGRALAAVYLAANSLHAHMSSDDPTAGHTIALPLPHPAAAMHRPLLCHKARGPVGAQAARAAAHWTPPAWSSCPAATRATVNNTSILTMIPAEHVLLPAIFGAGNGWEKGGRMRQQRRSGAGEARRGARGASNQTRGGERWARG